MRVSSIISDASSSPTPPGMQQDTRALLFSPFSPRVFSLSLKRHVPVFLLIGEISDVFLDPSICAHLMERTVAAHLFPGQRPDVELLCRRASALYSGEDSLPLCALLLENSLPCLAAPLPPADFPADPSRLLIWLTHADRRFVQNRAAFSAQAANVLHSYNAPPLSRPYTPHDAAHDLLRAILSAQDTINGGFGKSKSPCVPFLRFLAEESKRGSRDAHKALSHALLAMKTGALFDPVSGLYFSATLTEDWRVFIPEKPLATNALIASVQLSRGLRGDAIRTLDALLDCFSLSGGLFASALRAGRARYSFTSDQVTKALGNEDGLRACRLLGLLHRRRASDPEVSPSRFSPPQKPAHRPSLDDSAAPLCPIFPRDLTPEDEAFLRRVLPRLARIRFARESESPSGPPLAMDCALAAAALAQAGRQLGEMRYTQAAQRAVLAIMNFLPDASRPGFLVPTILSPAFADDYTCGASSALALALLTLAQEDPSGAYAGSGLRLLGSALHAFVREDGMVMHTPQSPGGVFPRVPAIYDSELPSPAALLVHALRIAVALRPDMPYIEAIESIWHAAAPYVRHEPAACAGLIEAVSSVPVHPG